MPTSQALDRVDRTHFGTATDLLYEYVFGRPDLERCGVLVGQTQAGSMPVVAAIIPLRDARPPEQARLGHEEWAYALRSMASYYPGLEVVGWWVSRQGGRARLSRDDRETHRQFLPAPGQVLLSFDTTARTAAVFAGADDELRCVHRDRVAARALTGSAAHLAAPAAHGPAEPPVAGAAAVAAAGLVLGAALFVLSTGAPFAL